MIVSVHNAERLDPAICTHVRGACVRMSTLVFHDWAIGVFFSKKKKTTDFLVLDMKHEELLSNWHTSGIMQSNAKHSTPTPSNAAMRCAQPDNLFGNVVRILRRMTHLVQHFSLHL